MKIRPATRPPAPTAVRVRLVPCLQLLALSLAVLAACGTTPPVNDQVSRARSGLDLARTDPQTRDLPGAEMHQASEALAAAEAALDAREDMATVDHLAYLAQQRVAVLVEAGNRRAAETAVAQANTEREQMRLQARTQEADRATRNAADSQQQALAAQRDAQAARQLAGDAEQRARSLQTQLSELNAKKTDRGMVVTIGDVLFDTGQAQLKSGSLRSMDKLVVFLQTYPQRKAVIEGFTDSVGSDGLNLALSSRRAEAVRNALVSMGVAGERLSAKGLGEAFPVAGNEQSAGRQMNRRVEIVLSDDSGVVAPR